MPVNPKATGFWFLGGLALLALTACARGNVSDVVRSTTICELAKQGKSLDGARIRVVGVYDTDLIEHTTVTDPQCPGVVIAPYDADDVDTKNMKRFNDAVQGNFSDLAPRIFRVELLGKYVWRPNEKPHGAIYIEKVLSFKRLHNVNPWKPQVR